MSIVKLKIDTANDRETLCVTLAINGYKTWVEQESAENSVLGYYSYVCFELKELEELRK